MMESGRVVSSSHSHDHKIRVVDELTRGREMASQLLVLLRKRLRDDYQQNNTDIVDGLISRGLVDRILEIFNATISILNSVESDDNKAAPVIFPAKSDEDSGESRKRNRRGCYKRRRTTESWTKDTSELYEDGHPWRKYGQKVILNAEHPRNYFRCTHKYEQGCQATKQVQKIQDDPTVYRTIYFGHHTCKNLLKADEMITCETPNKGSSVLWNFESAEAENHHKLKAELVAPTIKEENKEGAENLHQESKVSSDYLGFSPGDDDDDYEDVLSSDMFSCTASPHSIDMDVMIASGFDDFINWAG